MPLLLRADHDGVATLTLNRPQARNALSLALLEALRHAFAALPRSRGTDRLPRNARRRHPSEV